MVGSLKSFLPLKTATSASSNAALATKLRGLDPQTLLGIRDVFYKVDRENGEWFGLQLAAYLGALERGDQAAAKKELDHLRETAQKAPPEIAATVNRFAEASVVTAGVERVLLERKRDLHSAVEIPTDRPIYYAVVQTKEGKTVMRGNENNSEGLVDPTDKVLASGRVLRQEGRVKRHLNTLAGSAFSHLAGSGIDLRFGWLHYTIEGKPFRNESDFKAAFHIMEGLRFVLNQGGFYMPLLQTGFWMEAKSNAKSKPLSSSDSIKPWWKTAPWDWLERSLTIKRNAATERAKKERLSIASSERTSDYRIVNPVQIPTSYVSSIDRPQHVAFSRVDGVMRQTLRIPAPSKPIYFLLVRLANGSLELRSDKAPGNSPSEWIFATPLADEEYGDTILAGGLILRLDFPQETGLGSQLLFQLGRYGFLNGYEPDLEKTEREGPSIADQIERELGLSAIPLMEGNLSQGTLPVITLKSSAKN